MQPQQPMGHHVIDNGQRPDCDQRAIDESICAIIPGHDALSRQCVGIVPSVAY